MRVVHKDSGTEATVTGPNPCGLGEMIVQYDEGDASSEYIRDWTALEGGDEVLREFLLRGER